MNEYSIENNHLKVCLSTYGAELISLQSVENPIEFLWQGNPTYWARRGLVMFPIVGSCPHDTYYTDGKEYKMPVNGFAKLSEFVVIEQVIDRIIFKLCSDKKTMDAYPYEFLFFVEYALEGCRLKVQFTVENKTDGVMPFAIGGHPGFKWPFFPDELSSDYILRFETKEEVNAITATGKVIPFLNNNDNLLIKHTLFSEGALYLTNLRSDWVELSSTKNNNSIRIYRNKFPYLILWSQKAEDASFLCIEPVTSMSSNTTSLFKRRSIIVLNKDDLSSYKYYIEMRI